MSTDFKFGENQSDQFDLFGGDSMVSPQAPPAVGGSTPTSSLQPKELRLERISMALADSYSIKYHYLHRTAKNSKIAFGIFARGELHGIMIWGLPVAKMKGQFGNTWTQLELRRMYCDETLPKNSESRCLAMAAKILAKLFPQLRVLVAYSDLSQNHKGGIYKAAGWIHMGVISAEGWSKKGVPIKLHNHNRTESGDKVKWMKAIHNTG
jgi:hypothetical protein